MPRTDEIEINNSNLFHVLIQTNVWNVMLLEIPCDVLQCRRGRKTSVYGNENSSLTCFCRFQIESHIVWQTPFSCCLFMQICMNINEYTWYLFYPFYSMMLMHLFKQSDMSLFTYTWVLRKVANTSKRIINFS